MDRVAALPRARRDPVRVMGAVHEIFDVVPLALDAATVLSRVGAVAVPAGASAELAALLHGADEALYRAKAAGRDRVAIEPAGTISAAVSNSGGARSTSE